MRHYLIPGGKGTSKMTMTGVLKGCGRKGQLCKQSGTAVGKKHMEDVHNLNAEFEDSVWL